MDHWVTLWKIVLLVAIVLFTGMSLWVIVAGVFDIKKMFASLRAEEPGTSEELD